MSHLWLRSMQQYGSVRPRDYTVRGGRATARSLAIADDGCAHGSHSERDKLCFRTPERWQSGRMRRFAKPLYGLTPVPRVRIPPSPPVTPRVKLSSDYCTLPRQADLTILSTRVRT